MTSPYTPQAWDAWWEATRDRRLTVQHCHACGHHQHYPRVVCLGCGGDDLEFADASGHGTVDSFTVVRRAPRPDVPVPYVLARVRLAEGPVVLTHLTGSAPDAWRCDEPVQLAWQPLPGGRHLPVFVKG